MNIFQSLWIGPKLSLVEKLSITSFLQQGDAVHLYTYDEVKGVPDGTTLCDANEIIPRNKIFTTHHGSVAHFADWFRWKMLIEKGNYWIDMDMVALKPFDFEEDIVFGMESYNLPNVAILKFSAHNPVLEFLAKMCEHPNKLLPYDTPRRKIKKTVRFLLGNRKSNVGWGEAGGPRGFRDALKHFDYLHYGKPFPVFYPISFRNWQHIFDDLFSNHQSVLERAYAIHLWNEGIQREKNFDVNKDFSRTSIFGRLLRKYGLF